MSGNRTRFGTRAPARRARPQIFAEAPAIRPVSPDVEYRPVRVYTTHRRLRVPVRHMTFRGDYAFHCSVRCSRAMATNPKDALATVGVADSEYRDAISRSTVIDQVSKHRGLKIGKCPVCQPHDLIGAASGRRGIAERFPSAATCGSARRPAACRPNKGPRTGELDR